MQLYGLTERVAFWRQAPSTYQILDRKSTESLLARFYDSDLSSLSQLETSMLYLVLAIGALSRVSAESGSATPASEAHQLYGQAWALFASAFLAPSVTSVQVLLLNVSFTISRFESHDVQSSNPSI
jgi:hypothetical protein